MFTVHLRAKSGKDNCSFQNISFRLKATEMKTREAKFDANLYLVVQVY